MAIFHSYVKLPEGTSSPSQTITEKKPDTRSEFHSKASFQTIYLFVVALCQISLETSRVQNIGLWGFPRINTFQAVNQTNGI